MSKHLDKLFISINNPIKKTCDAKITTTVVIMVDLICLCSNLTKMLL